MNDKRAIYLREKLTDDCPRLQSSAQTGVESSSQKRELEARDWAHISCCFYNIRDHAHVG